MNHKATYAREKLWYINPQSINNHQPVFYTDYKNYYQRVYQFGTEFRFTRYPEMQELQIDQLLELINLMNSETHKIAYKIHDYMLKSFMILYREIEDRETLNIIIDLDFKEIQDIDRIRHLQLNSGDFNYLIYVITTKLHKMIEG